jgi:hypothetical protein
MKTKNAVDVCLKNGVMEIKYVGIIEIYPCKATNSFVLDAALHILSQTHEIVRMTDNWLRAFEMRA